MEGVIKGSDKRLRRSKRREMTHVSALTDAIKSLLLVTKLRALAEMRASRG